MACKALYVCEYFHPHSHKKVTGANVVLHQAMCTESVHMVTDSKVTVGQPHVRGPTL